MTEYCQTPGCDNEAKCLNLCASCYSALYYWQKRSPQALIDRARRLQLFEARMDLLMPANVEIPRYRRTSAKLEILPGNSKKDKKYRRKQSKLLEKELLKLVAK